MCGTRMFHRCCLSAAEWLSQVDVIATLAVVEERGPDEQVYDHTVGAKGREIWTVNRPLAPPLHAAS